jgi:hypothetical protein
VCIVVNLYVLVYWQSPQDKNDSYYAKAIVVRALSPLALAYGWRAPAHALLDVLLMLTL